ncbi:DUF2232 domain-containing protein [Coralliovum pocilloporae]|uniref:DUF2232 domain-containing protein n=1 Tax=Coralliovum pocilloporae TaxID=3066369 RepID=UPI003306E4D4
MLPYWLIGILSGLGAAVLNFAALSGTGLGLILVMLSPLPIFIASLGWGNLTGLIAAAISGLSVAIASAPLDGFLFCLATGLPAFWLSNLAGLSRTYTDDRGQEQTEWYPVGNIVAWASGIASALVILVFLVAFSFSEVRMAEVIGNLSKELFASGLINTAEGVNEASITNMMMVLLPLSFALFSFVTLLGNLYLSARIVRMSGRLARPWPDLSTFELPQWFPILFALVFAVALFLDGMIGRSFQVIAISIAGSFLFLGLAVLHVITRGRSARPLLLGGLYLFLFFFGWIGIPIMILGAIETSKNFRGRFIGQNTNQPDSE